MSANTILLDFTVSKDALQSSGGLENVEKFVLSTLEDGFGSDEINCLLPRKEIETSGTVAMWKGPRGSIITMRIYIESGLVTINLDYYLGTGEKPLLSMEDCRNLEAAWSAWSEISKNVKTLPPLKRGIPFDIYFYSSDERLLEYDIDKVLYDERSAYQHIQIYHSLSFGNFLVLDDLQNLAESDLPYTEAIMSRGTESYEDKEILILGGGDGALLHELRKEKPKMITMIEIDDLVMQACKIYLRSACGNTLDSYTGDNYKIVVGDCVDYMEKCFMEEKKFDYIFGDLTDIPITPTPQGEVWEFITKILNLSLKLLVNTGKFMTHGNGASSPSALQMYENLLDRLDEPVIWTNSRSFVPSFMETWVFYQISKKKNAKHP